MAEQTREEIENSIKSLERFIQQIYWGEDLSPEQSKDNIEKGLIQINLNVKTYMPYIAKLGQSNGLLITKDGYFLTAKHCVDHDYYNGTVMDSQGRHYTIEKICALSKDDSENPNHRHDLALAKAKIDGPSEPMNYRIFNTNQLKPNLPVSLFYYDLEGRLKKKFGLVKQLKNNGRIYLENGSYTYFPDQFVVRLDITAERGHSGGIIVCPQGRLVGIASNADVSGCTNVLGGIKFIKALEMVDFHKRCLVKKLEKY